MATRRDGDYLSNMMYDDPWGGTSAEYGGYNSDPWGGSGQEDDRDGYSQYSPDEYNAPAPEQQQQDYSAWGGYNPEGLDQDKVESGWDSPKYQIAKVLSNFDPSKGITSDVLNALNSLNLGDFYSDDPEQLGVRGETDPRFEDYLFDSDIVKNFTNDGNSSATWGSWGGSATPAPTAMPTASPYMPTSAAPIGNGTTTPSPDPFAAIGGGVQLPDGGWVPKNHPLAQQLGLSNSSSSSSSSTTIDEDNTPNTPPGVNNELWSLLMQRAKQGLDVDRTNPNVRSQADAYSAQEERARRNFLGDQAERNSPYSTGSMLGQERMTAASMGQRVGAFESELVGREIQARRDEIQHSLSEMGDLLTDQQRLSLQQKLSEMDNALERLKSDRQDAQYYSGLSEQGRQADLENAYRYANLDQNQSQFLDQLGFNTQKENNYWDWTQRGNS